MKVWSDGEDTREISDVCHMHKSHIARLREHAKRHDQVLFFRELNPATAAVFEEFRPPNRKEQDTLDYLALLPNPLHHGHRRHSISGKPLGVLARSNSAGVISRPASQSPERSRNSHSEKEIENEDIVEGLTDSDGFVFSEVIFKPTKEDSPPLSYAENNLFYFIKKEDTNDGPEYWIKTARGNKERLEIPQGYALDSIVPSGILRSKEDDIYLPDYDPFAIGDKGRRLEPIFWSDELGFGTASEFATVRVLITITDRMTRHGAENRNHRSYKLGMSEERPITAFPPDGTVVTLTTEGEVIGMFNEWRKKGYNLEPNPRWGWEVDKAGHLFKPEKPFPFETLDRVVDNIDDEEQQKRAQTIRDTFLNIRRYETNTFFPMVDISENLMAYSDRYVVRKHLLTMREQLSIMAQDYSADFGENGLQYSLSTALSANTPYWQIRVSNHCINGEGARAADRSY